MLYEHQIEDENILDSDVLSEASDLEPQYVISQSKFVVLSFLTLGLYGVWWMFKSWKFFKEYEKEDIMPAARAIFSIIFLIPLLNQIQEFAKRAGYTNSYSSGALFAGFLIASLLGRLPDPFWLVSIFSFVFLIPGFNAMNFALRNTPNVNAIEQESFNARQIILMIVGGLFTALVVLAVFMEPDGGF